MTNLLAQRNDIPPGLLKKIEETVKERQQQRAQEEQNGETVEHTTDEVIQSDTSNQAQAEPRAFPKSEVYFTTFNNQIRFWRHPSGQLLITIDPTRDVFLTMVGTVLLIWLSLQVLGKIRKFRPRKMYKVRRIEL